MSDIIKYSKTFALFSIPSFIGGIAQSLDISGSGLIYNESESEAEADSNAIKNDWSMVGYDLKTAVDIYAQTIETK